MSNLRLFSVHDLKLGAFSPPFAAANEGTALRTLSDMLTGNPRHPFAMHPGDYVCYEVGEFDELTGMVVQSVPRAVCNLTDIVSHS